MDAIVITYGVYLAISIGVTVWVARTLFTDGLRLLVDVFQGDEVLAASVNRLLSVGFYLISLAVVCLALPMRTQVVSARGGFEALAEKVGTVLLVLWMIHFVNFIVFTYIRYCNTGHRRAR
ncbi:MAG TPA: hypothetical protein VFT45_22175 [Longimicrobium sp.]|nr:hypothetical protein [Longimicrobium sp.]